MKGAALDIHVRPLEFPAQGTIHDLAGHPVDANGWVWSLNHPVSRRSHIDFRKLRIASPMLVKAVVLFMAERVQVTSTDDARNAFEALCHLNLSDHFRMIDAAGGILDEALFADLRNSKRLAGWRLHHIRMWYRWCASERLPGFSDDVALALDEITIGGNEKGRAVITRDPLQGAFDELELVALRAKLRSEDAGGCLNLDERVLVWLALALGRNPLAYALQREEDYRPLPEVGTGRIYHRVDIPRIKKGGEEFRAEFREEMLNDEIGKLVAELIEHNRAWREANGWPAGCAFPLFMRHEPRPDLMDGPRREYAMHHTAQDITTILQRAVDKLDVVSHRTGEKLHVNSRRFRRTFGTRGVEEGASPAELAAMLDHSDLQNVMFYFETRSSQVERLDAALALKLGPIAKAFMGRIVEDEADAVNGGDPSKRITGFGRTPGGPLKRSGNVGTCGAGACGLFAPLSCYTCGKFQPWRGGPHQEMLDWLCEDRAQKEKAGLDRQIVGIHDATILAVAEVVRRCQGSVS